MSCHTDRHTDGWWRGLAVTYRVNQPSYSTPGPVSTWMGDCPQASKPSWYKPAS